VNLAKGFVNRYFNAGREGRIYEFQNDATAKPEIRIVIDEADKVAGLWYKPWEDELK
jgi:hypothetical protein